MNKYQQSQTPDPLRRATDQFIAKCRHMADNREVPHDIRQKVGATASHLRREGHTSSALVEFRVLVMGLLASRDDLSRGVRLTLADLLYVANRLASGRVDEVRKPLTTIHKGMGSAVGQL